jgi:hypothetical protein
MRVRLFALVATSCMALLWGAAAAALDTAAVDSRIKMATDYLQKPGQEGGGEKAFRSLVDAVAMIAPEAGFSAEFGKKVAEARGIFESDTVFNEKGISLLKESCALAGSGKEFRVPEGISNAEQATAHILKQVEKARTSLKQKKTGECARLLLEAALMIVTPMGAGS